MTLDSLFSEIDTASELYAFKRMLRVRAFQLIDSHFEKYSEPVEAPADQWSIAVIDQDVPDSYGDTGEIVKLSANGYTVRGKETGDHSDLSYSNLDTEGLLLVVGHLEEVRKEIERKFPL